MMKIRSHSESHVVELDDGSKWQIFPGDLDMTLNWKPDTDLKLERIEDEISSHALVSAADGSSVRVIPAGEGWPGQYRQNLWSWPCYVRARKITPSAPPSQRGT